MDQAASWLHRVFRSLADPSRRRLLDSLLETGESLPEPVPAG